MQPFDYRQQVVNPFEQAIGGAMRGFQLGASIRQMQEQREAARLAQEQQEELRGKLTRLQQNPNPTFADYEEIAMFLPKDQAEGMRKNYEMRTKEQQDAAKRFSGQVVAALSSRNKDAQQMGITLLKRQAEAERNKGNIAEAEAYELHAKIAETGDPGIEAVRDEIKILGTTVFGKEWVEGIINLEEARRKEALGPEELKQATAEAVKAKAEADKIVEKLQTDLDLTKAQIDQSKAARAASEAAARASGAEAERKRAEAQQIASGIIPPEKRPDFESRLRKEYSDQTKGYQEVEAAYGRVLASQPTAAGDLALIFNYMKMLDPGSVVREGEFATAQNAAGVPDRVTNLYNNLLRGERLNENQRQMFMKQAQGLFSTAQTQEKVVRNGITRIAEGYGLNTKNIFYEQQRTIPQGPVTVTVGNRTFTFPNQESADEFKRRASR